METEASLLKLQAIVGKELKFTRALTSSVTTSWGVDWSEEFIARDLLQNFFDANRQRLAEVKVKVEGSTVTISAPEQMELDRLFYLGSEKGEEDVGQYGEGFKVATVCLLRNHAIEPVVQSGNQVVAVRLDGDTVSGTKMRPLVYDFYTSATPYAGTQLILRGCGQNLVKALQTGLDHFFYEGNPLLGDKLWESRDGQFSIYRSTTAHGHIFYRRLKRGSIPEIPVVLVIEKQCERIEKMTRQDRDRKAFGEELMKLFNEVFARGLHRSSGNAIEGERVLVLAARQCWLRGHPLLSAVARYKGWNDRWAATTAAPVFGDSFYARIHTRDAVTALEYETIEKEWQKQGRKPLPAYFNSFGVKDACDHARELKNQALEEQKKMHQRPPSKAEQGSLDLLREILGCLAPCLFAALQQYRAVYSVAETDVLLGELKENRKYRNLDVFFSSQVFTQDFAEALAVYLHEHAHIFGYDGSRDFTDELTRLIESVVRKRKELDSFERKWAEVRAAVQSERKIIGSTTEPVKVEESLRQMTQEQLLLLLKRVPEATLLQAINNAPGGVIA